MKKFIKIENCHLMYFEYILVEMSNKFLSIDDDDFENWYDDFNDQGYCTICINENEIDFMYELINEMNSKGQEIIAIERSMN